MSSPKNAALRSIPAVESLLRDPALSDHVAALPHAVVVRIVRDVVDEVRAEVLETSSPTLREAIVSRLVRRLALLRAGRPARVINATGIILHTNLGRAVMGERVARRLSEVARSYSDLELDLETGERGRRERQCDALIRALTGAEASLVVNNCAAAVFLVLETLARGREVVVSRGELVEIGGSFRMPDVLARSGARLVEVGTTNKTRIADYRAALTPETAILLKVHTSNFRITGFTESASTRELAELAAEHDLTMVHDLGSGATGLETSPVPGDEPSAGEEIKAGAHVVAMSGDKLLGGPQAGLIVGERERVRRMASNALYRALRPDKLTLAALSEALLIHLEGREREALPALRMLSLPAASLEGAAASLKAVLDPGLKERAEVSLIPGSSETGGGALPTRELETTLVSVRPKRARAHEIEERLRSRHPAILVRVQDDCVLIDPRTLLPGEADEVVRGLTETLGAERPHGARHSNVVPGGEKA